MNPTNPYQESAFRRWWKSRSFIQKRLIRFCMSMLVMVLCFPLYYLGFFGSVEGPLHPASIGDGLAGLGVTQTHVTFFLLSVLTIAVTWNWICNFFSLTLGARLTCSRKTDENGNACGALVRRSKTVRRKTGESVTQYVCVLGHKRSDAHFHPIKKGAVSHSMWAVCLAFVLIVLFM